MKKILLSGILLSASLTFFTGCVNNEQVSQSFASTYTGCRPEQIQIENENQDFLTGMHTWTAYCKGEEYYCNYHTTSGARCNKINN